MSKFYTNLSGLKLATNIKVLNTESRWIYDKAMVYNQISKWEREIPWIKPYYAVKSNPLPHLIRDIVNHPFKVGLDVASLSEFDLAVKYTDANNIIYTNLHTINHEIETYKKKCINIKVVDCVGELKKTAYSENPPKILIRINSGNSLGDTKFDTKFGATLAETNEMFDFANKQNISIHGISFHIGSGGEYDRKKAYCNAYKNAEPHLEYIRDAKKIEKPIINFGGGLLHDTNLHDVLGWTKDLPFTMIAEPGRYISEPSHHLLTQVIAITSRGIILDNGIYHELNCFQRDNWTFPYLTHSIDIDKKVHIVDAHQIRQIFGPTCDSGDTIGRYILPANIQEGDWIILPNMGAYTNAGMIEFNGIKGASSFDYVDEI